MQWARRQKMFEKKEALSHVPSAVDGDIARAWNEWVYAEEKIR